MIATFPASLLRKVVKQNQHGSPRVAVFFHRKWGAYIHYCVKPAAPGPRCSAT